MAMGWLLLTLLGLGIVGAPFFVLYLLVQHRKLRGQVNQLSEENSRQHATFTREVAELKKQLAGVGPIAGMPAPMPKPPAPEAAAPAVQPSAPRAVPPIAAPPERRWETTKPYIPPPPT